MVDEGGEHKGGRLVLLGDEGQSDEDDDCDDCRPQSRHHADGRLEKEKTSMMFAMLACLSHS